MGHTENSVFINKDIDSVFKITNQIDKWKDLFTEYKESTVLKTEGNKITFRLTTFPEENGEFHSWTSERIVDSKNYCCHAKRLEPAAPFEYMNITWRYAQLNGGTEMTWIQDFKPAKGCAWDDKQFEDFLNAGTKAQMKVIKVKIENGFE